MSLFTSFYNVRSRGNKLSATLELHCRTHILVGKQKLQGDLEGMNRLASNWVFLKVSESKKTPWFDKVSILCLLLQFEILQEVLSG